jgi:hypothetical protein
MIGKLGKAFFMALDPITMMDEMEWIYTFKPRRSQHPDLIAWYIRLELWMQTSKGQSAQRMRKQMTLAKEAIKEERKAKNRDWLDHDIKFWED